MGWNGHVVRLHEGSGVTIDQTDPAYPVISASGGGGGGVDSVVAGQSILIDATDPANPVVSVGVETPGDFGLALIGGTIAILAADPTTYLELTAGTIILSPDSGTTEISMNAGIMLLNAVAVRVNGVFTPGKYSAGSLPDPAVSGEGAIAFDTSAHDLVTSDGSAWQPLAGAGGGVQSVTTDGEPIEVNNTDPLNPVVEFNRHNAFYIVHGNPPSPVGWLGQVMYFASDVSAGWTPGLHLSDNTRWLLISAAVDPG